MTLDMLGRPHQALDWYSVASKLTTHPGEVDPAIGDCWVKLGDDEQAVRAYTHATELRPNSFEGAIGIAHLRLLEERFEDAREICRSLRAARGEADEVSAEIEFFTRKFAAAKELYANLEKDKP